MLGIEPAVNIAEAARQKHVPTRSCFFGTDTAREMAAQGEQADLLIGNNVLAQVPDLNDFVAGMKIVAEADGCDHDGIPAPRATDGGNQFDTIYHEHFSYFSFLTVEKIFAAHGLTVFDVEEIPTHGGSLRVYARHADDDLGSRTRASPTGAREEQAGLTRLETYGAFDEQVKETKRKLLEFLIAAKRQGSRSSDTARRAKATRC